MKEILPFYEDSAKFSILADIIEIDCYEEDPSVADAQLTVLEAALADEEVLEAAA